MPERPPEPADPAAVTADPVTAGDIAEFLARLARQRSPALGGDPADRAELLTDKADLFARIAHQHTHTNPALADQARDIAGHARAAATDGPTTHPGRRTTAPREPRPGRAQPLHAEVDHGSTSARGRPPDRAWLVRLRRDNRAVIIATGLARSSADHLASKINTLLRPPDTEARHAQNVDTHDTTDVNDLASPTAPRQGISLSDTAEFRRASSPPSAHRRGCAGSRCSRGKRRATGRRPPPVPVLPVSGMNRSPSWGSSGSCTVISCPGTPPQTQSRSSLTTMWPAGTASRVARSRASAARSRCR